MTSRAVLLPQIVSEISEDLAIHPSECKRIIEAYNKSILGHAASGKKVNIYSFGKFIPKTIKPKRVSNNINATVVFTEEKTELKFKSSDKVTDMLTRTEGGSDNAK